MTALSTRQLEAKAATTVTSIIAEIPSLTPNQNNNSSTNIGQSNFNLRGIGANRTLVLLDGLRLEDTSPTGGFNANILPALLINGIEVVTGGKIDLQSTVSNYGDDAEKTASIAFGKNFAGDKLHLVAATSVFDQPSIVYENSRPWGRRRGVKRSWAAPSPPYWPA